MSALHARNPRRTVVVATLAASIALAACATPTAEDTLSATQGLPDTTQALEAHTWVLDPEESDPRIRTGAITTLAFDDDVVTGQAPCNTYRGRFDAAGDSIEIGPLTTTMVGCDRAISDAETAYLAALAAVDTVDVTDRDRVVLTGDDVTLVFDRIDVERSIVDTWTVTSIRTGDALVTPVEGTDPSLSFAADGTLEVSAGCEPTTATWAVDGSAISVDAPGAAPEGCPSAVEDQDRALLAALGSATRVEVTDRLTLLDDEGRTDVVAVRASD